MADRRDGYSRRGGDRSYHDSKDRRRDWDGPRDRADRDDNGSRRHNGGRDYGRDRDRERDHRRYRSRSRDRGDRRRSRSPGRDRGHDRRDGDRDGQRDRGHRRREEDRAEPQRDRGDRSVRGDRERSERDKPSRDRPHDRDGFGATESPRRSTSPKRTIDRDGVEHSPLPTRVKPSSTSTQTPSAPVSFKVKNRDGSHGPEARNQATSAREDNHDQHYHDDGDRHQPRGRFDAEPMDEDDEEELEVEDEGLDDMAAMMGFGGFGTTKGKKVIGNNVGAARKEKKTEYRQYMNRVGGFNRPLSPGR